MKKILHKDPAFQFLLKIRESLSKLILQTLRIGHRVGEARERCLLQQPASLGSLYSSEVKGPVETGLFLAELVAGPTWGPSTYTRDKRPNLGPLILAPQLSMTRAQSTCWTKC